jgi:hypothetical protein
MKFWAAFRRPIQVLVRLSKRTRPNLLSGAVPPEGVPQLA